MPDGTFAPANRPRLLTAVEGHEQFRDWLAAGHGFPIDPHYAVLSDDDFLDGLGPNFRLRELRPHEAAEADDRGLFVAPGHRLVMLVVDRDYGTDSVPPDGYVLAAPFDVPSDDQGAVFFSSRGMGLRPRDELAGLYRRLVACPPRGSTYLDAVTTPFRWEPTP